MPRLIANNVAFQSIVFKRFLSNRSLRAGCNKVFADIVLHSHILGHCWVIPGLAVKNRNKYKQRQNGGPQI